MQWSEIDWCPTVILYTDITTPTKFWKLVRPKPDQPARFLQPCVSGPPALCNCTLPVIYATHQFAVQPSWLWSPVGWAMPVHLIRRVEHVNIRWMVGRIDPALGNQKLMDVYGPALPVELSRLSSPCWRRKRGATMSHSWTWLFVASLCHLMNRARMWQLVQQLLATYRHKMNFYVLVNFNCLLSCDYNW